MTHFEEMNAKNEVTFNGWYEDRKDSLKKKPLIVACIPAYNEELSIAKVILQAQQYVQRIIVCDDGSNDLTSTIAEHLGADVIRHHKNAGYGASLRSLFKVAKEMSADVMVTLDADGQHNPASIPKILAPITNNESDIVIGSRFIGKGREMVPKYRQNGIKIINKLAKTASYGDITDTQSGLRAYNRRAIELLHLSEYGMGASTEILIKAKAQNLRVSEVPVVITYDERSSTEDPLSHGIEVIGSTIKHMSINKPILFYGVPGGIVLMFGIVFWFWALEMFSTTRYISANAIMIAMSLSFAGLMLITTALMLWVLVSVVREKD